MGIFSRDKKKIVLDLQMVNDLNAEGCPACGRKFCLGETVVLACGAWDGGAKLIHDNEAVFDSASGGYVERRCYESQKG